jgi:hypothetical protein
MDVLGLCVHVQMQPPMGGGWACDAGSGIGSAVRTCWATAVLDESTSIRSIAQRRIEMGVKVGSMASRTVKQIRY